MVATTQKNVATANSQFRLQIGAASSIQGSLADTAVQPDELTAEVNAAVIAFFAALPSTTNPLGAGLAVGQMYWNGGALSRVEP